MTHLYHITFAGLPGVDLEEVSAESVYSLLSAWHCWCFRFYRRGGELGEVWLSGLNHPVHTLPRSDVFPSGASITASSEHMARQVKSRLSLDDCEQWFLPNPQSQHDWAEGICQLMDSVSRSDRKWCACLLAEPEGPMA